MNQNRLFIFIVAAMLFPVQGQTSWTILSPGDKVKANVQLADLGGQADYPSGKLRLYFSVSAGGPSAYSEVIPPSPMGLERSDQNFVDNLRFVSEGTQRTIDSTYIMITGKRSICRNYCNEKVLIFETLTGGARFELVLRAYDDGFAFRYRFPGTGSAPLTITSEATGFRLPQNSTGWLLPYNINSTSASEIYSPAYEDCWRRNVIAGTAVGTSCKPVDGSWCMPALFRTPGGMWALLFESDVSASYCGSHLSAANQLVYRIAFPNASEANNIGAAAPSWTLPWTMPWRIVITGASPGTILESTLSTDLASPSAISDVSWIKPGRSSWSWWSANSSPSNYSALTPFVDLAKQMTWEYSLVDAGWQKMTGGTLQSLLSYANSRNVGLFIWYNSGGPNNTITEGPRDCIYDSASRVLEFQKLRTMGAKGIKIDFFISDKQKTVQYYLDIFRDAAQYNLMVNIHGCTPPRGWQRTWPNLITAEAVRGAEQYIWSADDPAKFPWQNTMMPFTRNAIASMDWTPVSFSNNSGGPHQTTYGHELALSVIFESGIQHFADRVAAYQTSTISAGAQAFLQHVPVAWDDTRFVQGYPGSWVVLARRKGNDWYAAGIAGDTAKNMNVSFSFLRAAPASYQLTLITDGTSATTFSQRADTVSSGDSTKVNVPARGGWVAKFTNLNPTTGVKPTASIRNVASAHQRSILCAGRSLVLPDGFVPCKTVVSVCDLTGKLLKKRLIRNRTIDIQRDFRLPQAIYIVRFEKSAI
jgi:hypothetical protein